METANPNALKAIKDYITKQHITYNYLSVSLTNGEKLEIKKSDL